MREGKMEIVILVLAMIVVGLAIGYIAGLIWKAERPFGASGDYLIATVVAVVTGLIDWFVIPALGFSETMRNLGVIFEPAILALAVLWLIRVAKR